MASIALNIFGEESENEAFLRAESEPKTKANKRYRFVLHFLANGMKSAKEACISAGYSAKTATVKASQLMAMSEVKILIAEEKKKLATKLEIDAEFLAKEALYLLKMGKGEVAKKTLVKTAGGAYISHEPLTDGGEIKGALEILGKLTGTFSEKTDHTFSLDDLKEKNLLDIISAK